MTAANQSQIQTSGRKSIGTALAKFGMTLTLLAPVVILIGALGTKFGLLNYRIGLLGVAGAALLLIIGALIGLLALIVLLTARERRGRVPALVAVAGGVVIAAVAANLAASLPKNPGIHDVATDWSQPIMFSPTAMAARGPGSNPVEPRPMTSKNPALGAMAGKSIAEINAATCEAAKPTILPVSPSAAFTKVKAVVASNKMTPLHEDAAAGVVEATDSTFWFGFKDDVAFRIRPEGQGSRIDLRSISRVGGGDLGANCKRIARLKAGLTG